MKKFLLLAASFIFWIFPAAVFGIENSNSTDVNFSVLPLEPPEPPAFTITVVEDKAYFVGEAAFSSQVHLLITQELAIIEAATAYSDELGDWVYGTGSLEKGQYNISAYVEDQVGRISDTATDSFKITYEPPEPKPEPEPVLESEPDKDDPSWIIPESESDGASSEDDEDDDSSRIVNESESDGASDEDKDEKKEADLQVPTEETKLETEKPAEEKKVEEKEKRKSITPGYRFMEEPEKEKSFWAKLFNSLASRLIPIEKKDFLADLRLLDLIMAVWYVSIFALPVFFFIFLFSRRKKEKEKEKKKNEKK